MPIVKWLTFSIFKNHPVTAAISVRGRDVKTEWSQMADELGFSRIAQLRQVHGSTVKRVCDHSHPPYERADALITDTPGLLLLVRVADCAAVFLFDPVRRAIALVHAGWKGLASGIIHSAVSAMGQDFGSDPSRLLVSVGPSLGPCCASFTNPEEELPGRFHAFIREEKRVDLWAIIRDQLDQCGIRESRCEFIEKCTVCNPNYYYSHRRKDEARMGAFLGLTP